MASEEGATTVDATDLDHRVAELKDRCKKLSTEDRERVLDAWAQVITLFELPHVPGEPPSVLVSLSRPSALPTNLNP